MENIIASTTNRPLVNTGIMRGKRPDGKAVAGLSNGFALGMADGGTVVTVSVVKVGAIRIAIPGSKGALAMELRSSARALSRMIIMTCKRRGGMSIAKSVSTINGQRLGRNPASDIAGDLAKHVPKLMAHRADKHPNRSTTTLCVHNHTAIGSTSPLVVMSNVRHSFSRVSPSRVRDVSMLGSTSTATICNMHKTGKIVLIAAGHNGSNGTGISFSNRFNVARVGHVAGVIGTRRCTALVGRNLIGRKRTPGCARRSVRLCHGRSDPFARPSGSCVSVFAGLNARRGCGIGMSKKGRQLGCFISLNCFRRGKACRASVRGLGGGPSLTGLVTVGPRLSGLLRRPSCGSTCCCGHFGMQAGLSVRIAGSFDVNISFDCHAKDGGHPGSRKSTDHTFGGVAHAPTGTFPLIGRGKAFTTIPGLIETGPLRTFLCRKCEGSGSDTLRKAMGLGCSLRTVAGKLDVKNGFSCGDCVRSGNVNLGIIRPM